MKTEIAAQNIIDNIKKSDSKVSSLLNLIGTDGELFEIISYYDRLYEKALEMSIPPKFRSHFLTRVVRKLKRDRYSRQNNFNNLSVELIKALLDITLRNQEKMNEIQIKNTELEKKLNEMLETR